MASAAVERLKEGADAILRVALEQRDRPQQSQVPQSEQERLAAAALAAARDVDDIFERAKLACTAETEDEVKREVRPPYASALCVCDVCVCVWTSIYVGENLKQMCVHVYICVGENMKMVTQKMS